MKRWIDGWMTGLLLLVMAGAADAVDVERGLEGLIRAAGLGETAVGVYVVDLDDDQVLASINADEPMVPASNMKLLTTAAAMDLLGAEFVFRTELGLLSPDAAANLGQPGIGPNATNDKPALYIHGDGDPAFGDPVLLEQHDMVVDDLLNQWLDAIVKTGITDFDAIYIDDRVFDRRFAHPTWPADDLNEPWCAQIAGINFYRNTLDVSPIPTRSGEAPRIELFPTSPFLQTSNLATTGKKDSFWTQRKPGTNVLTFRGSVKHRPAAPWRVTLHDPPTYFATLLQHKLAERGVKVGDVRRVSDDAAVPETEPLHVVQTTLPLVIARTNQDSQNMFAEALFKRIGRSVTGGPGSWESGSAAMRIFLREAIGPQASIARVADGSGLSRDNRVTARMLVDLLKRMHANPDTAEPFRNSLAFGGTDAEGQYHGAGKFWTRERRFKGLPPDHWAFGKSGYIRGVSTLSGYLVVPRAEGDQRTDPHVIAFSFLFNDYKPPLYNHHLKKLQDKMVRFIGTSATEPARLGG